MLLLSLKENMLVLTHIIQKIEVGYGEKVKTYDNIDEVMNDAFYHGKSLKDICNQLQID